MRIKYEQPSPMQIYLYNEHLTQNNEETNDPIWITAKKAADENFTKKRAEAFLELTDCKRR